jgi:hypothetical protein
MDQPQTLAESIAVMPFPVYGIVGNPLDLQLHSYGSFGGYDQPFNISYKSPRYPVYPGVNTFRVTSWGSWHTIPSKDGHLEKILEEQPQPVPSPLCWEGEMMIANTHFRGTITYYSALTLSAFGLRSEKTLLRGKSYGPSYDELVQLLEGLQVLNSMR